jgi:phosphoribosyl 1,2-cyclic phosphodiesterase
MLHTYFLNDFEMVPVAPIINRITFVFTFHIIIIIILGISSMQGIYAYIPETNLFPREHCVATILM